MVEVIFLSIYSSCRTSFDLFVCFTFLFEPLIENSDSVTGVVAACESSYDNSVFLEH